jgi:hypothetical protein
MQIPFCFLQDSKVQVYNPELSHRTAFQYQFLKQVSERPDFAYFVVTIDNKDEYVITDGDKAKRGPAVVSFIARDGACHTLRLGASKPLSDWHIVKAPPLPLGHQVYTSRLRSAHPNGVENSSC